MALRHLAACILLAVSSSALPRHSAPATPPVPPAATGLKHQLDAAAPAWLQQNDVPSVSIAYIEHGKLAWTAAYGNQSPGVPATGRTLYNIASLTKPLTAETVLRLASIGKLSLDEPMSPFWLDPDLKGNPWADLLTPRIALTHQTGFANWRRMTGNVLTFKAQPGTAMGYSGEGYQYVARFTEKKLGIPFTQLAQQYVFDAIGMKDTSYIPQPWFSGRVALPHIAGQPDAEKSDWPWNAADLVHTTAADYARFILSVMHDDSLTPDLAAQRRAVSRELVTPIDKIKLCPAEPSCTLSVGMGLGWQVNHFDDITILEHTGSDTGIKSLALFVPRDGTGIVVLTNGENGNKVIKEVVRLLYPNRILLASLQ